MAHTVSLVMGQSPGTFWYHAHIGRWHSGSHRRQSREASAAYFAEQDLVRTWIAACCAVDPVYSQSSSELYRSWKKWAEDAHD